MKTDGGLNEYLHTFLISTKGREWSASRYDRLTLENKTRCQLKKRLGGPRTCLDVVAERIPAPAGNTKK